MVYSPSILIKVKWGIVNISLEYTKRGAIIISNFAYWATITAIGVEGLISMSIVLGAGGAFQLVEDKIHPSKLNKVVKGILVIPGFDIVIATMEAVA